MRTYIRQGLEILSHMEEENLNVHPLPPLETVSVIKEVNIGK